MSKVAVVTDSTATIPRELIKEHHISVAPQILIWGQEMFEDGVDIQPDEFYQRLEKSKTMPSTSQVTPKSFLEIFNQLHGEGYDILAVLISEKLSGTIASAVQAREQIPQARIEIVDSRTTAMAMGFPVIAAAKAAAAGASLEECKALAERAREHTGLFVTVDTLEFLHRGGRIGGGARFLATALNIKPILELRGGRLEGVERVRTRTKALNRVVELVVMSIGDRRPLHLASLHANAHDDAQYLLEQINEKLPSNVGLHAEQAMPYCSKCGKVIQASSSTIGQDIRQRGGVVVGGDGLDEVLYEGTICQNCGNIYCISCQSSGPCLNCGNPVVILFADLLRRKESTVNGEVKEAYITEVSPVIGTHAGPGTVGVCFMAGI